MDTDLAVTHQRSHVPSNLTLLGGFMTLNLHSYHLFCPLIFVAENGCLPITLQGIIQSMLERTTLLQQLCVGPYALLSGRFMEALSYDSLSKSLPSIFAYLLTPWHLHGSVAFCWI